MITSQLGWFCFIFFSGFITPFELEERCLFRREMILLIACDPSWLLKPRGTFKGWKKSKSYASSCFNDFKASYCNSDSVIKLIFPANSSLVFFFSQALLCPQSGKQQMAPAHCVQVVTLKQFYNDQESQVAKWKAVLGWEQHLCSMKHLQILHKREKLSEGIFCSIYCFPMQRNVSKRLPLYNRNPPGSHVRKVLC